MLRTRADAAFDEMVDTRRAVHRHPELSFEEHHTTTLIRDRLSSLGMTLRDCPTATGAVALLEGSRPGTTVLLRADIDALPVREAGFLSFRSERDGVMHACGHDAHTAVLLGVARMLTERADELAGRYLFIFQPAEEVVSGARAMIDGGVLDGLTIDAALGWHIISVLPLGTVYTRPGVLMSEVQGLRIALTGSGGHGAIGGPNVVLGAADVVRAMPDAVSGMEFEGARCACSAGTVHAGTAMNVLPDRAVVEGTLRTYTADQRDTALERLHALVQQAAGGAGAEADLTITGQAPPVENDAEITEVVMAVARDVVGEAQVLTGPPMPPSDDVSEFLRLVPGCYFFVGGRPEAGAGMHHSPSFAVDEAAMRVAADVMANAAMTLAGA